MKNIFISSTFIDMQAERDLVQERVLPALRDEARKYGDNVGVIDLRWGVDTSTLETEEGAAKVLKVCLDEIDRSHPYMLIFLGERYGTMMREDQIEKSVRGREDKYTTDDYVKSITALEVEYGALSEKYGELNHCVVCFREPVVHMLDGAEKDLYAEHTEEGKRKLEALKERIKRDLGDDDRLITYSCTWDKSARQLVDFKSNGQPLENVLTNCFVEMFRDDWKEYESLSWQDKEQLAFCTLMESKLRSFVGREALLEEYYQSAVNGTCPIILQGEVGSGKTAIMCKLVKRLQKEGKNVFAFFAGAGSMSTNAELLLQQMVYYVESLVGVEERYCVKNDDDINQIEKVNQIETKERNDEENGLFDFSRNDKKTSEYLQWLEYFNSLCCRVSDEKIYFFIDALELLEQDEHVERLDFALKNEKVQVVLTCVDGYSLPEKDLTIKEISRLSEKDAKEVLEGMLASYSRNTYDSVEQKILSKENAGNPLYISLMIQRLNMMDAEELGKLKKEEEIIAYVEEIVVGMPEQLEEAVWTIIDSAINRIDGDEKFLWEMVRYIAVSRDGLRSQDLQMICNDIGMDFHELDFLRLKKYLDVFFYVREDDRVDLTNRLIRQSILENIDEVCIYEEKIMQCIQKLDKEDTLRIHEGMYYARLRKNALFAGELIAQAQETKNEELLRVIKREALEDEGEFYSEIVLDENEFSEVTRTFFRRETTMLWGVKKREAVVKKRILTAVIEQDEEQYQVKDTVERLEKLCLSWHNLGTVYSLMGQAQDAMIFHKKAMDGHLEIYEREPNEENYEKLGPAYMQTGVDLYMNGNFEEAIAWLKRSVEINEKVCNRTEQESIYFLVCKSCSEISAGLHLLQKKDDELFWVKKELELAKKMNERIQSEMARICLSNALESNAKALLLRGSTCEAMEYYTQCIEIRGEICREYPTTSNYEKIMILCRHIADAYIKLNEREQACSYYELAIKYGEELYKRNQRDNDYRGMAYAYKNMGLCSEYLMKYDAAWHYYTQSIEWIERYFSLVQDVKTLRDLSHYYILVGMYCEKASVMGGGQDAAKCALAFYLKYVDCHEKIHKELKNEGSLGELESSYTAVGNALRQNKHRNYWTEYDEKSMECLKKLYSMRRSERNFYRLVDKYWFYIKLLKLEGKNEKAILIHDELIGICEFFYTENETEKYRGVLSVAYYDKGVTLYEQDKEEAISWFEKAADMGHPNANHAIGTLYRDGTIVAKNAQKAVEYFERATEQGDPAAMNALGMMYATGKDVKKDVKKAVMYYEKAAELGDDNAKISLAGCLMKGKGIKKDVSRAITIYTELAEQGDVYEQVCLGYQYLKGKGVKKNISMAVKWFDCAAKQGNGEAQLMLGTLYYRGKGVEKNQELACELIGKAAKGGHPKAIRLMKMISGE